MSANGPAPPDLSVTLGPLTLPNPILTASGYVVARRKAVVSAKIQGRLSELRVEEGSVVRDGEVALSPSWSIHSGCGTSAYRFVWAMGGENQRFDDMDPIPVRALS